MSDQEKNIEPEVLLFCINYLAKRHKKIDIMRWCQENDFKIHNMVDHLGRVYVAIPNNIAELTNFRSKYEEAIKNLLFSSVSDHSSNENVSDKKQASMKRK
jgi:hypothetical protein